jgi:hypothetical protein
MNKWAIILNQRIRGQAAAICAFLTGALVLFMVFEPLRWRYFPDIPRILQSSWLHLLLSVIIITSGVSSGFRRPGFPIDDFWCLVVGLIWRYTPLLNFIPFDISWFLILFGLTGLCGHWSRNAILAVDHTV